MQVEHRISKEIVVENFEKKAVDLLEIDEDKRKKRNQYQNFIDSLSKCRAVVQEFDGEINDQYKFKIVL